MNLYGKRILRDLPLEMNANMIDSYKNRLQREVILKKYATY